MKTVIAFYVFLALTLLGFGFAGPTAGAPAAVVCGSLGLLGFLAATAARIGAQQPHTGAGRAER